MASLSRIAAAAAVAVRSASRSAPLTGRVLCAPLPSLASPSAARSARILRRSAAAASVGLETLMPLHSAVAAARLRSCIAVDSSCWSSLSQGILTLASLEMTSMMCLVKFIHCAWITMRVAVTGESSVHSQEEQ